MDSPHLRKHEQVPSYCMKCLELLDMINLWEVGVDGAARNFSRIRRELTYVLTGLQTLEKVAAKHTSTGGSKDVTEILMSLKTSIEKAVVISHNAASACFNKTKPGHHVDDPILPTRGYSISGLPNTKSNGTSPVAIELTKPNSAKCHTLSTKRPLSVSADLGSFDSSPSSSSIEDSLEDRLFTISENHFQKSENKDNIRSDSGYTEWTVVDPLEFKPKQRQKSPDPEPYRTHIRSVSQIREDRRQLLGSKSMEDSSQSSEAQAAEKSKQKGLRKTSLSPTLSDASDPDLQLERVMSKIAALEDERLQLLQTVEVLQSDNTLVRQSLRETLGTLEMKDVQLKLAMQDLGAATSEIKKASELNGKLRTLERERIANMDRLTTLEDESSAVKLSLIQLLQDKSAVNKHLALQNSHLQKQLKQTASSDVDAVDGNDNVDGEDLTVVHKQGFLVKRGGRVRTWRKRLFVLDDTGLAYYKTDQPIATIPLNQILSATVSREPIPYVQNLFEVQTVSRNYLCGASTHEEMQSWVGILQTLTQYGRKRGNTTNKDFEVKESDGDDSSDKETDDLEDQQ